MTSILLTQSNTFILGPIAKLLGWLMNAIYMFLNNFGIQNIGLCIILFTVVVYLCMLPLTIKQQKFAKMSAKMNPELQEIRKKYKGKNDQASMQKLNEETKLVYEKYGSSPSGQCLPLLVQMPIFFSLYRVINNIPAYVGSVKGIFMPLAESLSSSDNINNFIKFLSDKNIKVVNIDKAASLAIQKNSIIDALYKLSTDQWDALKDSFNGLGSMISNTQSSIDHMNNFLGINIANSPSSIFMSAISNKNYIMVIAALLIPVLSAITQIMNYKLMPQSIPDDDSNPMASSMKSLNFTMPIISAVFCFTLPAGMGIYWISGAVVRSIQQVAINKYLNRVSTDELVRINQEKVKKKNEKSGNPAQKISTNAKINTKKIDETKKTTSYSEKDTVSKSTENSTSKPGSLASKANLVKQYNEKNLK
ncbi:YidC/Oxa1 family membrane protein insertase [Anaerosacchariphilus polymeriproducens]|uniref:Membrane protein insertase YidC n=1 Tax=Anaerosacchariphilus polymeriproducens TaxID=1812858 RepID=A0A371AVE2_9FIRM|nr:YidC/Oxa1 family membrane protein insertase [Anaerosacchariphilus polymeriproducens]RDU23548.1 membrane protein insertase YidC [Anaerosacchariphilus polymeriproducens]